MCMYWYIFKYNTSTKYYYSEIKNESIISALM